MTKYIVAFFLGLLFPLLSLQAAEVPWKKMVVYSITNKMTREVAKQAWFLTKEDGDILTVRVRQKTGELIREERVSFWEKVTLRPDSKVSLRQSFVSNPDWLKGDEESFGSLLFENESKETFQASPFFFQTRARAGYITLSMKIFLPENREALVTRAFLKGNFHVPLYEEELLYEDGKLTMHIVTELLR